MSQIDYNDPKYQEAAAAILQRHDNNEPEANITSAVRDFLLCTGLVDANKVAEEVSPSDRSVRAVDLRASNTFIEIKKRIGTTGGFNPNETYVKQLDEYLAESMTYGRRARMGVLTDGRSWLLRWPNAGKVKTTKPYAFTLESAADWLLLYEWLRDKVIGTQDEIPAQRTEVEQNFGPNSPLYRWDIDDLNVLYQRAKDRETVRVKCRLWETLLRAALGEIAQTPDELDDLFVRHTYLSMVIGMVVQAYFGIDIRERAANDPTDLLYGRQFRDDTGLQDIIESDFFTWPAEVGGESLIERMAEHVARFNWKEAVDGQGTIRSARFAQASVEIADTGIRCHEPLASGDSDGRSSSRQRDRPAIAKPLQATRRYGQHDRGSPRIARVARPIGRRQASRDAGKATIGVIRNLWV